MVASQHIDEILRSPIIAGILITAQALMQKDVISGTTLPDEPELNLTCLQVDADS